MSKRSKRMEITSIDLLGRATPAGTEQQQGQGDRDMQEDVKKIRIEYEQLAVEEAKLREKLAAVDTKKAELRVRMAEIEE